MAIRWLRPGDWQPLVWVGNHDVGFTVVTETSDGWTSTKDAIRLRRRASEIQSVWHLDIPWDSGV